MTRLYDLSIESPNALLPVVFDVAWNITQPQVDQEVNSPTFGCIRAYFDSALTEIPQLVIDSGKSINGVRFQSLIRFAYSGEPQFFKGYRVLSSGVDRFGNVITSTAIGADILTEISEVKVFGGSGGS